MKTNIYDLGYIYLKPSIQKAKYANRSIDNLFSRNIILGMLNFILKFIHSIFYYGFRFTPKQASYNGIVFYGLSRNNCSTLKPLINEFEADSIIQLTDAKSFPMWKIYWYAFPHLPDLLLEYCKVEGDNKKKIRFFFAKFWRIYGCNKLAKDLIDFYQPKLIIMANDHLEINRAIMGVANNMGVKTMYVQHAAISETFPPLKFTYSMLDGYDSFNKYKRIGGIEGRIYLCGGVRFDNVIVENRIKKSKKIIGIAINAIDDTDTAKELCLFLKNHLPQEMYGLILRPHPAMAQEKWAEWCANNNIGFSNSKKESSFNFLNRINVLLSNQCSIHLDAAVCRIPSIVYNMASYPQNDVYSFVKNGLVREIETKENILDFIVSVNEYSRNVEAVRYYNSSYATEFEHHVAEFITRLINVLISDDNNCLNNFNKNSRLSLIEETNNYKAYKI